MKETYMVRHLLGNVECCGLILESPISGAKLTQNRVERLPHSGGSDVPSGHVETQYLYKALCRISYRWNGQYIFRMSHEAMAVNKSSSLRRAEVTAVIIHILGDPLEHRFWLQDKGR